MTDHVADARGRVGARSIEEITRDFEDIIVARLERMDRANARLRRITLGLAIMVALLLGGTAYLLYQMVTGGAAFASRRVSAREFVLAGADGKVRGTWGTAPDGSSRLAFRDRTGRERLRFTVLGDGGAPGLTLLNQNGIPHVVLGILPDGTSSLVFADAGGKTRAVFGISGDASNLVFADREGITRAGLGVDARGRAELTLDQEAEPESVLADSVVAVSDSVPPEPTK